MWPFALLIRMAGAGRGTQTLLMSNRVPRRALFVFCLLPLAGFADRDRDRREAECARLTERIERLQSKLRSGHSARRGRRWRAEMRKLELKRFRRCR